MSTEIINKEIEEAVAYAERLQALRKQAPHSITDPDLNVLLARNRKIEIKENLKEKRSFWQKNGSNFHIIGQKAAVELAKPWVLASEKSRFTVWSCLYENVRTYFKESCS